jgi:phosphatidylinositol alpha-1,6-mannosyltransferase
VEFVRRRYRRPTRRFVEAGALAWLEDIDSIPGEYDWVSSLELCALVTGQASVLAQRRRIRQAVFTWSNNHRLPLYYLPPYRQAVSKAKKADLFVCTIEAALEHCVALGIPEERCALVRPPLDCDLFSPAEEMRDEPTIVFASPVAPNKGIDRVLDAFDIVRRKIPEARLKVLGRGPLEDLVRWRARETGGAVVLVGHCDRKGVAEHLRSAAVFCTAPRATPVWDEQFGLAYIEAMACGLPVVTTECGTSYEAVPAPNLRLTDHPHALAEGLLTFLNDAALRKRVGEFNRTWVVDRHEHSQQIRALRAAFDSASGS